MLGWHSNVDINTLYFKACNLNIDLQQWPEWITEQIKLNAQITMTSSSDRPFNIHQ
jgi:hypothetical protein